MKKGLWFLIIIPIIVFLYYLLPFVLLTKSFNVDSKNVSYTELQSFLDTNQVHNKKYQFPFYVCQNYAVDLYNDSQRSGIRCLIILIDNGWQKPKHAFNAFVTIDKGIVFADCSLGTNQIFSYSGNEYYFGKKFSIIN
jgi:hypothetical protein